jgi:hypothetical protein
MCSRPRPRGGRASFCKISELLGRWDCINARQRERAKEARFGACTSVLTSPVTRKPPPKCGAFRLYPRGSPLRQTGCWRKADSNSWSHLWMWVSLGERDGNNGVRERCSRIRQWTPIGFEWHEPSASAAAEERRGVGTNVGRYVPPLERSGETEDSNPVPSGKESGELPTASAAFDDCHRRLSSCAA